jgi:hypothetical protein
MKKFFFVLILLFSISLLTKPGFSQSLTFCEGVDAQGNAEGASSTFNIPSGGGYFYFLVNLGYEVGCSYVNYDIYKLSSNNAETYNTTISQDDMTTTWTWFWKKVTFYESGRYHIYVYDCDGTLLTSSYVTIKFK